ncbi:O(6)-methylguanine-induced apoptosis 2 isoform X1 [Pungitius pungitius]|uniref:O(6)-methylguanine-induced apoptosis 2 isoform X1 n=1 Tax=Pungitius pungitius TaxID=134920 RepID=UPI002E1363A0
MGRSRSGHKHKMLAHTVSPSMRTKSRSVVMANEEMKGFLSEDRRFSSQVCLTAKTFSNPWRGLPGPNTYNLQNTFVNKNHFSIRVSSVFRLPAAVPKHTPPSLNQYDVGYGRRDSLFSVDGTSAFLSKAGHKSFFQIKDQPSPSSDHLIQKAILSPFKSKSQRTPPPDNRLPGPGAYSPYQTPVLVKRSVLPEGFYSAIAAPAMIVDPPSPGHGHYIRDFNGLAKHPTSTAVFASRTERISQHLPAYMRPDPGFYDTQIGPKQSFCRNHSTGWLPV